MLNSNQPYNRVDDGIGTGLLGGAVVGGVGVLGASAAFPRMNQSKTTGVLTTNNAKGSVNIDPKVLSQLSDKQKVEHGIGDSFKKASKPTIANRLDKTMFGSGRRTAVTAGAGIIGGALLGGAIDKANG